MSAGVDINFFAHCTVASGYLAFSLARILTLIPWGRTVRKIFLIFIISHILAAGI